MVKTISRQHPHYPVSSGGTWFHVFGKYVTTGKPLILGPYRTEEEAKQNAIAATDIDCEYVIYPSIHRNSMTAREEYLRSNK